ncbi:Xaa-Pro peptidase family protein [Granulicella mallensis]|uniref:Xaa-Pro aminopeptidase n=1 Tax=Granulicella mallensis TaxID=940614 RepID=A0A7W7ZSY1_9BACT|nr:Xaa-Pro peptidase family protein [Granulicella mallensis]MBB5065543.1 Xaa-Pro aminopeptidase [Granulicella mallensis]
MNQLKRRRAAMRIAATAGMDALLVTHPPDVRYLTGFTGSNGALALSGGRACLFTDGRYKTQAKAEVSGLRVVVEQKPATALAAEWLAVSGAKRCGFDATQTTVAALEKLRKALPVKLRRAFFAPVEGLVARLREVKDADELVLVRRAADLGCSLFEGVLEHVVTDATEAEVAAALEFKARMGGAEAMSFETIIASGERSALPHGRATTAKLPRRGFCTMDFGVLLDGYCSDMTRTVHLGKASQREWDVYHSVLEAQQAAVAAVAPGVSCGEVDEAARSVLRREKLDKFFSHSTGHGVGLEIHEGPRLAAKQEQVLEAGMVVTIEPGVYLPGEFGIRIEDMVLVTQTGGEVLTAASPKAWIEL